MSAAGLVAGLACAAGAAACFDGAVAWQAMEVRQVPRGEPRLLLRLARRPRWLAATALAALGWPLQLAALALAPVTLVQPALASGLIVLLVLGATVLEEHVGRAEIAGACSIIAGVAVLAFAAPERSTQTAGATALAVTLGALVAIALLPLAIRDSGRLSTLAAGAAFACTGVTSKLVSDGLAHGDAVAVVGWAALTGAVVLTGVRADMSALQRLPATRVAPAVLAIEVIVPVALAPLIFGEHWGSEWPAIVLGLALVTAGLIPLASAPAVAAMESR